MENKKNEKMIPKQTMKKKIEKRKNRQNDSKTNYEKK